MDGSTEEGGNGNNDFVMQNTTMISPEQGEINEEESEITCTFEQLITGMTGMKLPDISEYLKTQEVSTLKVIDIINMIGQAIHNSQYSNENQENSGNEENMGSGEEIPPYTPVTVDELTMLISGVLKTYGDKTIYENIGILVEMMSANNKTEQVNPGDQEVEIESVEENEESSEETLNIYAMVDSILTMLENTVVISYTVDYSGIILGSNIEFNFGPLAGKVELIKDYVVDTEKYEDVSEVINSIASNIVVTEEALAEVEGYIRTKTEDGEGNVTITYTYEHSSNTETYRYNRVYTFTFDADGVFVSYTYEYDYYNKDSYGSIYESYTYEEATLNSEGSVSMNFECNNLLWVSYPDVNGYYIDYIIDDGEYEEYKNVPTVSFYYDMVTGKIYIDLYSDSYEHNYKVDKTLTVKTEYGYLLYYVCSNCGEKIYRQVASLADEDLVNSFKNNYNYYVNNEIDSENTPVSMNMMQKMKFYI